MSAPTERVEMWVFHRSMWRLWDGEEFSRVEISETKESILKNNAYHDQRNNTRTTVKFGRVEFVEEQAPSNFPSHEAKG